MLCEVAALPFHAHANCETWSIDFQPNDDLDLYIIQSVYNAFTQNRTSLL